MILDILKSDVFSFFVLQTLAVMSPGPDFAIVSRNTLLAGRKCGLATTVGISTAIFIHVLYTALGVSKLLVLQPQLFFMIKVLGFSYLSFLGLRLIFQKAKSQLEMNLKDKNTRILKSFFQGFMTNLLNPKCILFFLSVFSVAFEPSNFHRDLKSYIAIIFFTTFVWFSFVSLFLSQKNTRAYYLKKQHLVDKVIGFFLILLSLKLLID